MANKLTDARRSLIRAKESALERLQQLEDERREIKAFLKSLDAALKALDKPGRRRTSSQPAADQGMSHTDSAADEP